MSAAAASSRVVHESMFVIQFYPNPLPAPVPADGFIPDTFMTPTKEKLNV